jgi:putative cardiolipin synthase
VRILTNSLDATDVTIVHSTYVKYRPQLLSAGVELYELKPAFALDPKEERASITGSSRASLHSKTLAVDGQAIFIGSFNFDPRSFALNTEMGVVIESSRLAGRLARTFDTRFPEISYRPVRAEDGHLTWEEFVAGDRIVRHEREPGATSATRILFRLLGLLPIEWLL